MAQLAANSRVGGNLNVMGAISEVNNTTTGGSYGVATNTSNASDYELTDTNSHNIVSFSPLTQGNFIIYIYYRITTDTNVTITINYTDGGGSQSIDLISGVQSPGSSAAMPVMVNAIAAEPITVTAQATTANVVYISATILGV